MRTAASCVPFLLAVLAGFASGSETVGKAAASPAAIDLTGASAPRGACEGRD